MSMPTNAKELAFSRILKRPFNQRCADCNSVSPTWCSIDFGVFVCLNCSGAHRNLGQHITRVRSTGLDEWTSVNVDMMDNLGNDLNDYWENRLPSDLKIDPTTALEQRQVFVHNKYVKRQWVKQGVADPKTRYQQCLMTGVPFKVQKPPMGPKKPPVQVIKADQSIRTFYSDNGTNNQAVADSVKQFKTTTTTKPVIDINHYSTCKPTNDWASTYERHTSVDKCNKSVQEVNLLSPPKGKGEDDWAAAFMSTNHYVKQTAPKPAISVQDIPQAQQFSTYQPHMSSNQVTHSTPKQTTQSEQRSQFNSIQGNNTSYNINQNQQQSTNQYITHAQTTPQLQSTQFQTNYNLSSQNLSQQQQQQQLYQQSTSTSTSKQQYYTQPQSQSYQQPQQNVQKNNNSINTQWNNNQPQQSQQPQQQYTNPNVSAFNQMSWQDSVQQAQQNPYLNNPFNNSNDILNLYGQQQQQQNKYDAFKNNPFV